MPLHRLLPEPMLLRRSLPVPKLRPEPKLLRR